jgi:redox-sensitive bicupin YhaK (pirin superfamily)
MIHIRKASDRGFFDHGWLKTHHSFSFGNYYDPDYMGFGALRVINEDFIAAGQGFPTHGHKDMEIITYVLTGAVAHKDSTGGEGVVRPGEIQKMTAGTGVRHSEYNAEKNQETHLYQIWLMPREEGLDPTYQQRDFAKALNSGEPVLLLSPKGDTDSIVVHQDAFLWARKMKPETKWEILVNKDRKIWVQILSGECQVKGQNQSVKLQAGDAAAVTNESEICLLSQGVSSEILVFDLA